MQAGLSNSWILSTPIILVGIYIAIFHPAAAKRMADMSHYTGKEKLITISASLSPHLFTLLSVFIPLSASRFAAIIGSFLYSAGLIGFTIAVASYIKTPPGALTTFGIYKISRNPMYVTALMAFSGIIVITLNILLAILLIVMFILHHMMILAEENACLKCFGKQYERYMRNTPRYMFL